MTKSRNIAPQRRRWTAHELAVLHATYADTPTEAIARQLGRSLSMVTCAASRHAAQIGETLVSNKPYHMVADEPAECGESILATVAALWEARAQIAEQARMIETYLADITGDQAEIARLRDLLRLASCGATAERQPSVAPAAIEEDAARYRWLAAHARSTTEHWGGRWSLVIEGPAPRKHDEEDALDEAVDAAMRVHRERFDVGIEAPRSGRRE